jgi:CDP-diacylglycerol--serine O-phosphatidyltransferase
MPAAKSPPVEQLNYRALRYLAPNAITAASLVFGMVSIVAAHRGLWDLAGWMIIYAVLTDRLDGMVARLVRGTSDLGVQLDSFADFLNFGLAPSFLMHSFLTSHPVLGFDDGWREIVLVIACVGWVMGAVFRLARFNVFSEDGVPTKIFFGIPTTLAGGLLVIWYLALLKYADPAVSTLEFGGARVYGDSLTTPRGVWTYIPIAMIVLALLMASNLRMLKVAKHSRRSATGFVIVVVVAGYVGGFLRVYPELMVIPPTAWILVFLVWGQTSQSAKAYQAPPLFPRKDDGKIRMRPQEDLALDDEE